MTIEENKRNRFLFLKKLYELSNGNVANIFDMYEVGKALNLNEILTDQVVDYLFNEHLVDSRALGGIIGLTHWGIKEVEQAIENPNNPTKHFLPVNIINIGTMANSSLQQGTTNSTINFTFNAQTEAEIEHILVQLNDIKDSLDLSNELYNELISELQTIEIQKKSSKPKSLIITESLKSIRTILESVAGNVMASGITEQISKLIER